MKKILQTATLCWLAIAGMAQTPTIPTPTQTDEIIIDNGQSGKADALDRIRYKVTIQNTGSGGATGTKVTVTPDPRTTLVPGSFRSSPLAVPDMYSCTGNVPINVSAGSGLIANDFDDNIPGLTLAAGSFATSQGGTIVIASDGGFLYTPPAGFTGTDTYSYSLMDGNGVGGGVPDSDVGLVTIAVSGMIWFIDNSSVAATSDGRLNSPFKTPNDFNNASGPAPGQVVFLKYTGSNYTQGLILKNSQQLFGSGHTGGGNLADVLPFFPAPASVLLPSINGAPPVLENLSGNGVTLAQNNTVQGVDVGNTSGYAYVDNGGTVGTLNISDAGITGSGGLFSLINGGTVNATLGQLASSGFAGTPLLLTNMAGSISNSVAGSIANNAGADLVKVTGGSLGMSLASDISKTGGNSSVVDVSGGHTGTLTFSGGLSVSGAAASDGMQFDNADGTYNFSGPVSLGSGTAGVNIGNGSSGAFNALNASSIITDISGISFRVNNSTTTVTYAGTLNHYAQTARGIEIINGTGGISFSGTLQLGNATFPMTTAEAVYLENTGSANTISFNALNIIAGLSGGAGFPVFVSNTSGKIAVASGSFSSNGNLGTGNYAFNVSNTTSSGVTFDQFTVDLDDMGESGGAIKLNNTPGTFTFKNCPRIVNLGATTLIDAANFGTLVIGSTSPGNISSDGSTALNISNGAIDIQAVNLTSFNANGSMVRLVNTSGPQLIVTGTVSTNTVSGSQESMYLSGVSTSMVKFGAASTVTIQNRRAEGILLNNCTGAVQFGNTTINNPNNITLPGIRSTGGSGSVSFAQANVDMNNAGGFETFTDVDEPGNNNGDGDALYITGFAGTSFAINGGTIENAGDDGIDIRNSQNLTLSGVIIEDCGKNPGVPACTVDCNSSGIQAYNLTGTNNLTGSTFRRGRLRNILFSLASGSSTLNISNCTFDDTRSQGSPATDNLQVYLSGSANGSFDIENSQFLKSRTNQISVIAQNTSTVSKLDITGITMNYDGGDSAGILVAGEGGSTVNFNIMNNPVLYSQNENVVTISAAGTSQVQGRIKDNPDMKFNTPSSGGSIFNGIRVLSDGSASVATVLIEGNTLALNNGSDGINIAVEGNGAALINATLNNNVLTASGITGIPLDGINAFVNPTAGGTKLLCLNPNNNTVSGIWARAARVRTFSTTGVRVTGYSGTFAATWTAKGNTGASVAEFATGGGTITAAPGPCPLPTNPLP
ncbi:MAG: Ig-like domain-containing protein [Candidatus Omnitrophica bacterium]|nr:Ig-like domain-containing protein [Candidatus Omnitrophota bacterium]